MAGTRLQGDDIASCICGLDADHSEIGVRGHVRQARRFLDPRIPDDCRRAAGLGDADLAAEARILDDDVIRRVLVDAIDLASERYRACLLDDSEVLQLVLIAAILETEDGDVGDVTYGEVGV